MSRFARNVVASGISYVVAAACQFSMQVLLVRLLGVEQYGVYVAAVAVVSFAELAFLSRAADLAMSRLSHDWFRGKFDQVRTAAAALERQDVRWTAMVFLLLALAGLAFSKLARLEALILVPLTLSIPAQAGYGVSKTLLIISGAIQVQARFEVAFSLTLLILGTIGALSFGAAGVVAAVVCANVAKTLLARKLARAAIPAENEPTPNEPANFVERDTAESVFSVTRGILVGASEHTDTLLLNAFLGPQAAGIYRLAKSLATLPGRIAAPVWSALRPRIAKTWSVGLRAEQFRVVAKPAAAMLLAMLVAAPLLLLYADPLITAIYGADSASAARPFLVLLIGAWIYQGATAWYRVTMLIERANLLSTAIFLGSWLWIVGLGVVIGRQSPLYMAIVVAGAYVLTSVMCWVTSFFRIGVKHGPKP
jgi:hypothetical protein